MNNGTVQAGPFTSITIRRTAKGAGSIFGDGGETPVAVHTPDGPWRYAGALELEELSIVSVGPEPIEQAPVEEPVKTTRRKPGPKPGRRKKVAETTPQAQPNEAQAALGLDPIEEEIKKAEASVS